MRRKSQFKEKQRLGRGGCETLWFGGPVNRLAVDRLCSARIQTHMRRSRWHTGCCERINICERGKSIDNPKQDAGVIWKLTSFGFPPLQRIVDPVGGYFAGVSWAKAALFSTDHLAEAVIEARTVLAAASTASSLCPSFLRPGCRRSA